MSQAELVDLVLIGRFYGAVDNYRCGYGGRDARAKAVVEAFEAISAVVAHSIDPELWIGLDKAKELRASNVVASVVRALDEVIDGYHVDIAKALVAALEPDSAPTAAPAPVSAPAPLQSSTEIVAA
jgi:hypothetical protein